MLPMRPLSFLMFQRIVALLAGSRYELARPVQRRAAKGDLESMRRPVGVGLSPGVDRCAGGVRFHALAVVGGEGRRQSQRRVRRFPAPPLERSPGGLLFCLAVAERAHRRCAARRRLWRQPSLGAGGPPEPVADRPPARAVHPHRRYPCQPDGHHRHRPSSLCRSGGGDRLGRRASPGRRSRPWPA